MIIYKTESSVKVPFKGLHWIRGTYNHKLLHIFVKSKLCTVAGMVSSNTMISSYVPDLA
jgi:hypothetical protein